MKYPIKNHLPVHPFFFGTFPILFLFAQNAAEMKLSQVLTPLAISCFLALVLTVLFGMILRNLRKGAVIASTLVFLFLSYGHFVRALPEFEYEMAESVLGPNLLILLVSLVVLVLIAAATIKTRRPLSALTAFLNLLGLLLVLLELVHGGFFLATRDKAGEYRDAVSLPNTAVEHRPDIYYIVVDGYGRSDILREIYNFDNSDFISELRDLGFYVADSSYANYPQTILSLGSSLNLDYIENVGAFPRSSSDLVPLEERLNNNRLMKFLTDCGYTTVGFSTGYGITDLVNVDRRYSRGWSTSEFETMLVAMTPLPIFAASSHSPSEAHRERVSYTLDQLPRLANEYSPKFVFAHIVSPHPPFLFDAEGNAVQTADYWSVADGSHWVKDSAGAEEYRRLYGDQATYITRRLLQTIRQLLDNCGKDSPVIIVQSDHGPGSGLKWGSWKNSNLRERFAILNAYYLPGVSESTLYSEITPVNTFRVVLNHYFGTDLVLLPDRHEFATWHRPFAFHGISKDLGGSAFANLTEQYRSLPPDSTTLSALSEPLAYGTRYYDDRNNTITERGLLITLGALQSHDRYEISVEYNDTYEVQFRNHETVIGSDTIPPQPRRGGELCVVQVTVPDKARELKYDNILIVPLDGDGAYSVGHVIPE